MTNTQVPHAAKLHHRTNKLKVVLRLDTPTHLVAQRALQPVSHCQRLHGALLLLTGVCVARAAGACAWAESCVRACGISKAWQFDHAVAPAPLRKQVHAEQAEQAACPPVRTLHALQHRQRPQVAAQVLVGEGGHGHACRGQCMWEGGHARSTW